MGRAPPLSGLSFPGDSEAFGGHDLLGSCCADTGLFTVTSGCSPQHALVHPRDVPPRATLPPRKHPEGGGATSQLASRDSSCTSAYAMTQICISCHNPFDLIRGMSSYAGAGSRFLRQQHHVGGGQSGQAWGHEHPPRGWDGVLSPQCPLFRWGQCRTQGAVPEPVGP